MCGQFRKGVFNACGNAREASLKRNEQPRQDREIFALLANLTLGKMSQKKIQHMSLIFRELPPINILANDKERG